jgi:small-conductance mechanosensitive channel
LCPPFLPPSQDEVEAQARDMQQLEQRLATQQRRLELIAQQQQHSQQVMRRGIGSVRA